MKHTQLILAGTFVAATTALLTGCGGGGGSSPIAAGPVSGTTVTVSPSLGKFSRGATVTLKRLDNSTIATGTTTDAGTALVDIGSYTGPLVIEVTGGTGVTYYDEGSKTSRLFAALDFLRAIAPAVQANVGVTPATHAAVEAIKANNAGVIPSAMTSDAISNANAKIATALGISDVLQAPKLVDGSTGTTLDLANVADKYALQLAALAKLASSGKTALDVAKDIAKDLSDDKLDGQVNGVAIPDRSTSYTAGSVSTDMSTNVKSAATDLGSTNTKKLVDDDSTVVGTVTPDVTAVIAPSPAVLLAKAMFAELRTTLSSFANSSKTGFLDIQALRASDDMKLVVAPAGDKLGNRLGLMGLAVETYEGAQTNSAGTNGVTSGTGTPDNATAPVWTNQRGNLDDVLSGRNGTQYCYIARPALTSSPVTCYAAAIDSVDRSSTPPTVKFIKIVLTPTGANQYTYAATRENRTWDTVNSALSAALPLNFTACGSGCVGTVAKTGKTSLVLSGTMPPSTLSTGADTWAISTIKTALTGNNYRYAVSGLVSTSSTAATPKPVSIALEAGSYIDTEEPSTGSANGTSLLLSMNLVGTAKTDVTQLVGTFTVSGAVKDKSGTSTLANSVVFSGVISDISVGGAGEMLTGKLETTTTGYADYNVLLPLSSTNYIHGTATFTGTVQAPSRPLMKLVVSGSSIGPNAGSATVVYTYDKVRIAGSGSSTPTSSAFTISNQDGIEIAADPNNANQNLITKASEKLATFRNGVINYMDGSSESFK